MHLIFQRICIVVCFLIVLFNAWIVDEKCKNWGSLKKKTIGGSLKQKIVIKVPGLNSFII